MIRLTQLNLWRIPSAFHPHLLSLCSTTFSSDISWSLFLKSFSLCILVDFASSFLLHMSTQQKGREDGRRQQESRFQFVGDGATARWAGAGIAAAAVKERAAGERKKPCQVFCWGRWKKVHPRQKRWDSLLRIIGRERFVVKKAKDDCVWRRKLFASPQTLACVCHVVMQGFAVQPLQARQKSIMQSSPKREETMDPEWSWSWVKTSTASLLLSVWANNVSISMIVLKSLAAWIHIQYVLLWVWKCFTKGCNNSF